MPGMSAGRDDPALEYPDGVPGKVRIYFKDFPLDAIHPWARTAAVAGRCMYSQSQDLFWNYHDWVYKNQECAEEDGSDAKQKILDYAGTSGADGMLLGRCLDDKTTAAMVRNPSTKGTCCRFPPRRLCS